MTTTPTEYPELPGLDNLETQARAADQDGQHIYTNPRDSNNWRANEIWHYLASPAAVLALIALARRAQPEGEAPQAEHSRFGSLEMQARILSNLVPATLSPFCGAQHAESGEPHDLTIGEAFKAVGGWMNGGELGYPSFGSMNALLVYTQKIVRAALAAQQAAAPGLAKPELMRQAVASVVSRTGDDLRIAWLRPERCDVGTLLYCAVEQAAPSAPGTPEAPQPPFQVSDEEMAALRRFWECASDGEGYDVEKTMMQRLAEMGLVQRKSGAYYMVTEFGLYVLREYTIPRAAQLDGGQEGSKSNG